VALPDAETAAVAVVSGEVDAESDASEPLGRGDALAATEIVGGGVALTDAVKLPAGVKEAVREMVGELVALQVLQTDPLNCGELEGARDAEGAPVWDARLEGELAGERERDAVAEGLPVEVGSSEVDCEAVEVADEKGDMLVLPLPPRSDCEAVGQGAAEAERAAVAEAPPEAQPVPLTVTAAVALPFTVGVPPLECVSAALRDEPGDEDAEVDAEADAATLSVPIWELLARPVRDPPAVVADARGEDEFIEDALMECEGLPDSKGELLCVCAGEAVESTGVAVPKLVDAFGDAEAELEFHAEVEAAAVRDELAVAEWTALGLALAIGDALPAPLLLAAPLALAQLDAQKVVVGEGV
jgi:hypothetical protein